MTALPTVEETWHNTFPTAMISDLPATDGRTDSSSRFDPQRIQKDTKMTGIRGLNHLILKVAKSSGCPRQVEVVLPKVQQ